MEGNTYNIWIQSDNGRMVRSFYGDKNSVPVLSEPEYILWESETDKKTFDEAVGFYNKNTINAVYIIEHETGILSWSLKQ